MAKQIKTEEDTIAVQEKELVPDKKVTAPVPTVGQPDPYILSVLQAFPAYEQLYVDKQGGIYTPDTPENIRGMAILYKNPYFTKP